MLNIIEQMTLGVCLWDIPALLLLVGAIIVVVRKRNQMKDAEKEMAYRLARLYIDDLDKKK